MAEEEEEAGEEGEWPDEEGEEGEEGVEEGEEGADGGKAAGGFKGSAVLAPRNKDEELLHSLIHQRLFGGGGFGSVQNFGASVAPGSPGGRSATASRSAASPASGSSALIFDRDCTFKPQLNSNSRKLHKEKIDKGEIEGQCWDRLHDLGSKQVSERRLAKEELSEEATRAHMNEHSKDIMAAKTVEGSWWDRMHSAAKPKAEVSPKQKGEKTEDKKEKKLVTIHKRPETFQSKALSQDIEGETVCTFKPDRSKTAKFKGKEAEPEGSGECEEEETRVALCENGHPLKALETSRDDGEWCCSTGEGCGTGTEAGNFQGVNRFRCEECEFDLCQPCYEQRPKQEPLQDSTSKNVSKKNVRDQLKDTASIDIPLSDRPQPRNRTPLMGAKHMSLQTPFQNKPGLHAYSRSHNGLTQNMVDLGDPVFEDLHRMLHSLDLGGPRGMV